MKDKTFIQKFLRISLGLAVLVTPAFAVIPFNLQTNSTATIAGGSWSGNGTIQANVTPGTATNDSGGGTGNAPKVLVDNFSSGALTINNMGGDVFTTGRLTTNPISAIHTVTLTGGTADLRLHNSNTYDGGANLHNSVGLTGFSGVTSISWTLRYSRPIAGRNTDLTSLVTRPMGAGLALITAGTNQSISSFTVGMNYTQIFQDNGGVVTAGVPSGAVPIQNAGFGTAVPGATSFTSNAFVATDQFLLVRGYDVGGTSGFDTSDTDNIYMTEMTWTIRRDDNMAFANNTLFVMSMDGQQYLSNVNIIPEPASVMLLVGSCVGGCMIRRRRSA